ncbi:MAG: cob(I)yrinic acid a,c-diamide adenosyltransferase [Gemmatimonadales bacterium]|nr:MAG: cob(I)yrinic acid a,c-diamide adenosyltransferase [Gemmatimonadales bacterium]
MKIYTRTGDQGETALFGGGRVPKCHPRVEAYGTVDELNAQLGRSVVAVADPEVRNRLRLVQHDLFALGAILASPPDEAGVRNPNVPSLPEHRIGQMEDWMDEADRELAPLRNFILPGGTPGAAELHVGRTVCRRAERGVVELAPEEPASDLLIRYLNRLSDLLFTLARLENRRAGHEDVVWNKNPDAEGET